MIQFKYTYFQSQPLSDCTAIGLKVDKTRGEKARVDGQSAYFLSKPTIGQVSTSWKFLLLVLRALVSTEMKSAPFPIPSCH